MADDHDIAKRALRFSHEARDYRLLDVPGYWAWSQRKLAEGENGALIAHLDATSMWLMPEALGEVGEADFEELLVPWCRDSYTISPALDADPARVAPRRSVATAASAPHGLGADCSPILRSHYGTRGLADLKLELA